MLPGDQDIARAGILQSSLASARRIGKVARVVDGDAERLGKGKSGVVWSLSFMVVLGI